MRVPEAIQRGQAFRAKECGPLLNRWYDGEFDCVGARNKCDWGFCLLTACCPWISWGYMARKMNLDACGRPTPSRRVVMWTFYGTVMLGILQQVMPHFILWILFLLFVVAVRKAALKRYKIRQTAACGDCLVLVCCTCCLALQTQRHMRYSGENPLNCQGPGARVVKQVPSNETNTTNDSTTVAKGSGSKVQSDKLTIRAGDA